MNVITFHGAAGTVTGSCYHLSQSGKPGILIDMGMYQGTQAVMELNQLPLQFDPSQLAGVLLTHAHLDHCGRLPLLVKQGFKGKVFMTEPTLDMIEIVLMDAARIAQKDDKVPILYTEEDVIELLHHTEIVEFGEEFSLGGYTITYREAGHILGAASIQVVGDGQTIVFSGDVGNYPHMMLSLPYAFANADVVVMESTYGGRVHPHDDAHEMLINEVRATEASGGVLLIPSFAIQRTQELLYVLKQLKDAGKVKMQTPIFLDSPMAIKVTDVYKRYGALYNDEFHEALGKFDPFNFPALHVLERSRDSRKIDKTLGPRIVIAGSGMMSGGRIVSHARKHIAQPDTRILFIGYQGEETLGREIVTGARSVVIENKTIPVRAHISHLQTMSAHADEKQLLAWLKHIRGVRKVFLTHGEDTARGALAPKVHALSIPDVLMPQLHDEVGLA